VSDLDHSWRLQEISNDGQVGQVVGDGGEWTEHCILPLGSRLNKDKLRGQLSSSALQLVTRIGL
jgi:hypothetical protein